MPDLASAACAIRNLARLSCSPITTCGCTGHVFNAAFDYEQVAIAFLSSNEYLANAAAAV